jgi:D-alanine-D-alanine ligase
VSRTDPKDPAIRLRREVTSTDPDRIRALTSGTGMFYPAEVDIAAELADERLSKGTASGYEFLFAEFEGRVAGYACFGPISLTVASWDLYWIAVDRAEQGRGIGAKLMAMVEHEVAASGGRQLYIETAGRPDYEPTRAFYLRLGYRITAELPDFYAPGDDKVIFFKRLG